MIYRYPNGDVAENELVYNYFKGLVNQFFKILPMRENEEGSLSTYLESLRNELIGCSGLLSSIEYNASFLTLLNILQYLIDHPSCSVKTTRREVFKAISICNKLKAICMEGGASE